MNELFKDRKQKYLNLMAMENCLCEISKNLKEYYKVGRARNKYIYKKINRKKYTFKPVYANIFIWEDL